MKRLSFRSQGFILVAIVALSASFLIQSRRLHEVTVTVEGPVGTRISGNYVVDGVEHTIDGEAPVDFVVTGRHVEFSIQKDTQPGEIAVLLAADQSGTARTTAGPGGTVQCGYEKKGRVLGSSSVWAHLVIANSE
jgi:hypothetical protein